MEKEYKINKILFLKDIYTKNILPSDEKLMHDKGLDRAYYEEHEYDNVRSNKIIKLPSIFDGLGNWPKSTNIKCWNCYMNFNTLPISIPSLIEPAPNEIGNIMTVKGCFCSFSCGMSYIDMKYKDICEMFKFKENLLFLYKTINGKSTKEILKSPSIYERVEFGGSMSNIEYKNKILELNKNIEG